MRSLLRFTLRQAQGEGNFLMVSLSNHETFPYPQSNARAASLRRGRNH
jgi:hypothetical protein